MREKGEIVCVFSEGSKGGEIILIQTESVHSRLSTIRSVHTYVILRTVYFDWICRYLKLLLVKFRCNQSCKFPFLWQIQGLIAIDGALTFVKKGYCTLKVHSSGQQSVSHKTAAFLQKTLKYHCIFLVALKLCLLKENTEFKLLNLAKVLVCN